MAPDQTPKRFPLRKEAAEAPLYFKVTGPDDRKDLHVSDIPWPEVEPKAPSFQDLVLSCLVAKRRWWITDGYPSPIRA